MNLTPHNVAYIRRRAAQGLSVNEIYRRCYERLTWDGPLPSINEIAAIVNENPAGGAGRVGPAGGDTAGPTVREMGTP